jgi:tRNA (cmo5U34)-methyltransferase
MSASDNATPHQATEYDRSVRQTIPFYETIHSQAVDVVRSTRPEATCWLDTGCGTGYLVELALPCFPMTSFMLTDPSEAMLEQAKNRLQGIPKNRVKFLAPNPTEKLEVYAKRVHPQVITAILAHHYLHESQRRLATLTCYRLLEEGGVFVTAENIRPIGQEVVSLELSRWKRFQIEHGRSAAAVEEHAKRFDSEYFPISIDEHVSLLHETGFKSVNPFWASHMQAGFYALK